MTCNQKVVVISDFWRGIHRGSFQERAWCLSVFTEFYGLWSWSLSGWTRVLIIICTLTSMPYITRSKISEQLYLSKCWVWCVFVRCSRVLIIRCHSSFLMFDYNSFSCSISPSWSSWSNLPDLPDLPDLLNRHVAETNCKWEVRAAAVVLPTDRNF